MTDETRDPPIDELNYLGGVTVVDIGDYRVSRGMTRREFTGCNHLRVTYDPKERRIWCRDCERDVEPFDAFLTLAEYFDRAWKDLTTRKRQLAEAEAFQVRSIAAKKIDEAWRKREHVPACPHCGNGLFPEDFKNGVGLVGREFAAARLGRKS